MVGPTRLLETALTPAQVTRIQELIAAGCSQREIAGELGVTRQQVQQIASLDSKHRTYKKAERDEAVRRVLEGKSIQSVADSMGISQKSVSEWVRAVRGKVRSFKTIKYSQGDKDAVCLLLAEGKSVAEASRSLKINPCAIRQWAKDNLSQLPPATHEAISRALEHGTAAHEIARTLSVPILGVLGVQTKLHPRVSYTDEQKATVIRAMEGGATCVAAARLIGCSHANAKIWFRGAVAAGLAKTPPSIKSKLDDPECTWITRLDPKLEAWNVLCSDWLRGETENVGACIDALSAFIERYLLAQRLPLEPDKLFARGATWPSFYEVACKPNHSGIGKNNRVHRFLEWVLRTDGFADEADDGEPVVSPLFCNPIPYLEASGVVKAGKLFESDKQVMSYWHVSDLRKRIAQGPHFRDWTWVQSLSGAEGVDGHRTGGDWFEVSEVQIDKSDPNCVWRVRDRVNDIPVLEMWSPVRWVLALVKLQVPGRTGQFRMSDSGEADTWQYQGGRWVFNTSPLAHRTEKTPLRQGILRRVSDEETSLPILYYTTNKTLDKGKRSAEKGQDCPWPHFEPIAENPYYWLQELRDWQVKFNPIDGPTEWRDIPGTRGLGAKSTVQFAEYLPTCFLFRTAENTGERHLPIGDNTFSASCWQPLLRAYEAILASDPPRSEDGQRILDPRTGEFLDTRLTDPETGKALITPHGLRVSLITHLVLDGKMDPALLMKVVGHVRLIMLFYYTKPGYAQITEAVAGAWAQIEATKTSALVRDLAGRKAEEMRDYVVFNAEEMSSVLPVNPADRNPLGWLEMHDGICLAGGNTGPLDGNRQVSGCHNGGPPIKKTTEGKSFHGPVPGGTPMNCSRCRWKCAGKKNLDGLRATLSNRYYHHYKQGEKAFEALRRREELLVEKAEAESQGDVFDKIGELKQVQRLHELASARWQELGCDIAALDHTLKRVMALPDHGQDVTMLALQGDNLVAHMILEEAPSELYQLAGINEDLRFVPDLDAGTAIYEFAALLDQKFVEAGYPMQFAALPEAKKLVATTTFMRALEQRIDSSNPILARHKAAKLLENPVELEHALRVKLTDLLPAPVVPPSLKGGKLRLVSGDSHE
jgi:transposase-like protein